LSIFSNNDNRTRIRKPVYPLACIFLLLTGAILTPSIIPSALSKQADDKDESKSKYEKKNKPTHSVEGKKFSKGDDESKKSTGDENKETDDEPNDEDKQPSKASAPIIITNTVTTPTSDVDKDKDGDDEDENEGPTRFGFVDSYFTDQAPSASLVAEASSDVSNAQDIPPVGKQEVEPGEGASTLVVILVNRGFSDVTSIRATLDFPSGFRALLTPKNIDSDTAISTFNGIVNAGKTFPLYFPVNVTKETQVGKEYAGSLNIKYFNVAEKDEEDIRDRTFKIPFKLSGKVILDAIWFSSPSVLQSGYHPFQDSNSNFSNILGVVPNEPNIVKTHIKNEGSAPATGVVVNIVGRNQQEDLDNDNVIPTTSNNENISTTTIQQSTVIPLVTAGTTSFNLGTIPAGGSMQINPIILPSISVGSILENIDLEISYNDAYGNRKTLTKLLGVQILPSSPESGLTLSSDIPSSSTRDMTLSSNAAMNKREAESFSNVSNGYRINNNYSYPLTQVSDLYYNDKAKLISNNLDNRSGDGVSTLRNDTSTHLVGGKVDDLRFNITNSNNSPITDAVVSLDSDTSSIKILGDSKWNLDKIDSHTTQQFLTKVFASKSLINSPVSFRISIQYIYNNQAKSDTFNLGANVVGDITVTVNDLAVNYIGGTPNLVGDLLNKGNTLALFTTIQLVEPPTVGDQLQEESPSSSISNGPKSKMVLSPATSFPQYLGDLEENSPLPFSIPLSIDNNTAPGIFPVSLEITYSDDLRNSYTVFNNGTVEFIPPTPTDNQGQGFLGFNNVILIMVIATIVGIAVIIIVRSRSKKRSKQRSYEVGQQLGDDTDIESLLDSQDSTDKEHIQKK
jgi:hypothetical protein